MNSNIAIKMNRDRSTILGLIKENRNILFGKYSENLTHQNKKETWVSIYKKGCDVGILDPTKGWRYLRDTVWQNWKKSSLNRVNNKKLSRSIRRPPSKLDEFDKTILEIVGSVTNKKECTPGRLNTDTAADTSMKHNSVPETSMLSFSENTMNSVPSLSGTESRHTCKLESHKIYETESHHSCETVASELPTAVINEENIKLKILKTKLELLEREAYLKDIEIYKKEKEVGLPMSKFTQKFYGDDSYSSEMGSRFNSESAVSQCKLEVN